MSQKNPQKIANKIYNRKIFLFKTPKYDHAMAFVLPQSGPMLNATLALKEVLVECPVD